MSSNPKDPLLKTGPEADRELFQAFSSASDGYPVEAAINAATNVLINAVRQSRPTREQAERAIDELIGRAKAILLDQHYDSTGRRKGIFPYDQTIVVPHFNPRSRQH